MKKIKENKIKLLSCLLMVAVIILCSCVGGAGVAGGVGGKDYSDEELESMYKQANAYEASANFDKAFELYEILYENEFPDKDFSSKGLEGAFETRKGRYTRDAIVCQMYEYAVRSLKNVLKDPNSLQVHGISMSVDYYNSSKINITIDYGASNSFGGIVRDDYKCSYTLSSAQRDDIYKSMKDFMDGRGDTSEKSADYLIGNYSIHKQSQYDAIVAGTCSY